MNTKGPAAAADVNVTFVSPCPNLNEVTINGNRLKFTTIELYEQYADNLLDRSILTGLANASSSITSMEESDPNDNNELYPEFLKQILNQDHIIEIGSFLIKVDLENERVLAINSGTPNAYEILVANQLSAQGLMNFHDDVSNGIEILIAVENGTLSTTNYQSAIENSDTYAGYLKTDNLDGLASIEPGFGTGYGISGGKSSGPSPSIPTDILIYEQMPFGCRHARREKDDTDPEGRVWDTKSGSSGCPDNLLVYRLENKLVYQKFVIYFSIQSKMKSFISGTCASADDSEYQAHLKLEGTAKFRKRCGGEQFRSKTDYVDYAKLNWRPYEASRSLSHYDVTVNFSIKHYGSTGDYITPRTHRITDGY